MRGAHVNTGGELGSNVRLRNSASFASARTIKEVDQPISVVRIGCQNTRGNRPAHLLGLTDPPSICVSPSPALRTIYEYLTSTKVRTKEALRRTRCLQWSSSGTRRAPSSPRFSSSPSMGTTFSLCVLLALCAHFRSPQPCSTAAPSLPTPLAPPGRLVRPTFAGRAGYASLYSDGAFVSLSETRRDQSNWYAAPRR